MASLIIGGIATGIVEAAGKTVIETLNNPEKLKNTINDIGSFIKKFVSWIGNDDDSPVAPNVAEELAAFGTTNSAIMATLGGRSQWYTSPSKWSSMTRREARGFILAWHNDLLNSHEAFVRDTSQGNLVEARNHMVAAGERGAKHAELIRDVLDGSSAKLALPYNASDDTVLEHGALKSGHQKQISRALFGLLKDVDVSHAADGLHVETLSYLDLPAGPEVLREPFDGSSSNPGPFDGSISSGFLDFLLSYTADGIRVPGLSVPYYQCVAQIERNQLVALGNTDGENLRREAINESKTCYDKVGARVLPQCAKRLYPRLSISGKLTKAVKALDFPSLQGTPPAFFDGSVSAIESSPPVIKFNDGDICSWRLPYSIIIPEVQSIARSDVSTLRFSFREKSRRYSGFAGATTGPNNIDSLYDAITYGLSDWQNVSSTVLAIEVPDVKQEQLVERFSSGKALSGFILNANHDEYVPVEALPSLLGIGAVNQDPAVFKISGQYANKVMYEKSWNMDVEVSASNSVFFIEFHDPMSAPNRIIRYSDGPYGGQLLATLSTTQDFAGPSRTIEINTLNQATNYHTQSSPPSFIHRGATNLTMIQRIDPGSKGPISYMEVRADESLRFASLRGSVASIAGKFVLKGQAYDDVDRLRTSIDIGTVFEYLVAITPKDGVWDRFISSFAHNKNVTINETFIGFVQRGDTFGIEGASSFSRLISMLIAYNAAGTWFNDPRARISLVI